MKSGAINIDRYTGGEPTEQFDFLYENFSIMQELLKDYREELITEVIEQKAYNRRNNLYACMIHTDSYFGFK